MRTHKTTFTTVVAPHSKQTAYALFTTHMNLKAMKKAILSLSLALAVAGASAATIGQEFEIERSDAFQQGITTQEEAKELLGTPTSISTDAEGNQTLWWKYVKVNLFGKDVRKLAIVFDKDGKMNRIAHREVIK